MRSPVDVHPPSIDASWKPLGQSWLPTACTPEPLFAPGWARVDWTETHLRFTALYFGPTPGNRALHLNERTWELGDVCEVFLQRVDANAYLEVHVTPENQRLQLLWPDGAIARVRSVASTLESYMVANPDWVASATSVSPEAWTTQVWIPADRIGLDRFAEGQVFRAAVCRYHYLPAAPSTPVLTSTAPLTAPSFHQRGDWHHLTLLASPCDLSS